MAWLYISPAARNRTKALGGRRVSSFDERETSMLMAIKDRIWVVLVSAGVGAAAFAIAHAAIPDSSGVIHGCYGNHHGSLRVVDDRAAKLAAIPAGESPANRGVQSLL
jgi:hypothetical protein